MISLINSDVISLKIIMVCKETLVEIRFLCKLATNKKKKKTCVLIRIYNINALICFPSFFLFLSSVPALVVLERSWRWIALCSSWTPKEPSTFTAASLTCDCIASTWCRLRYVCAPMHFLLERP